MPDDARQLFLAVPGVPVPKSEINDNRGRYPRRALTPRCREHMERVRSLFFAAYPRHQLWSGAVYFTVVFYVPIPKTIKGEKVTEEMRRRMIDGNIRPIGKPDNKNLLWLVEDALNRVAYDDDAQCVEHRVGKYYSETPRTLITLRRETS